MSTPSTDHPILGCWNYFVESGETKDERAKRLALCPDSLRKAVEAHVVTVFGIRRALSRPDRTGR